MHQTERQKQRELDCPEEALEYWKSRVVALEDELNKVQCELIALRQSNTVYKNRAMALIKSSFGSE